MEPGCWEPRDGVQEGNAIPVFTCACLSDPLGSHSGERRWELSCRLRGARSMPFADRMSRPRSGSLLFSASLPPTCPMLPRRLFQFPAQSVCSTPLLS